MYVLKNVIYRAKKPYIYDGKGSPYDCYIPCVSGECQYAEMVICTKDGERHPCHATRPSIRLSVHILGDVIGELPI